METELVSGPNEECAEAAEAVWTDREALGGALEEDVEVEEGGGGMIASGEMTSSQSASGRIPVSHTPLSLPARHTLAGSSGAELHSGMPAPAPRAWPWAGVWRAEPPLLNLSAAVTAVPNRPPPTPPVSRLGGSLVTHWCTLGCTCACTPAPTPGSGPAPTPAPVTGPTTGPPPAADAPSEGSDKDTAARGTGPKGAGAAPLWRGRCTVEGLVGPPGERENARAGTGLLQALLPLLATLLGIPLTPRSCTCR